MQHPRAAIPNDGLGPGAAQAEAGSSFGAVYDLDFSGAPDADPDGIIASSDESQVTITQSGTGHDSPARFDQRELADEETVTFVLTRGGITDSSKVAAFFGVYSSGGGSFGMGLNSHGTGVAQVLTYNGTTVSYVSTLAAQDSIRVTMTRRGSTVYVQSAALVWDADGSGETPVSSTTNVTVSGTVTIAGWWAINDTSAGEVGPYSYSGSYAVQRAA